MKVLAVVCARNEEVHIERCLEDLITSGCDVYLIDNDSNDGTRDIASRFLGNGLIGIRNVEWKGHFSLSQQLSAKREIIEESAYDWVIHADADEWLVSPVKGQTLVEAIDEADSDGYTVINFHECVFVPLPGEDFFDRDYAEKMCHYYFFQPCYPRLNRAWRRDTTLDNSMSGGHVISGRNINISPKDLILRHYIALNQEHARSKYVGRVYSQEDLSLGWHGNRVIINEENIHLRNHPAIHTVSSPSDHSDFDLSRPVTKHFWQWENA